MATITLQNEKVMPAIGFGTWRAEKGKAGASVKLALECGYRHIDCAHIYMNEDEIGENMAAVFKEGKVKREDVFVVSKLWSADHERVLEACKFTLKNLQLDYLDLYLIHGPFRFNSETKQMIPYDADKFFETWRAMENLVDLGLVRSIGLSNVTSKKLHDFYARGPRIMPVCNQVEIHPFLPQKTLGATCQEKGIKMVAYSPLGNPGLISERGIEAKSLLDDPVVKQVAESNKCTPAQVLLAWHVAHGRAVLCKSTTESRVRENLAAGEIKLSDSDVAAIDGIEHRHRYLDMKIFLPEGDDAERFFDGEFIN